MTPLWPDFATHWAHMGHAVCAGLNVASVPEAEAAAAQFGLPITARPLFPAGEYCAMLAEHPADVGLAFLRAAAQSQDGRVLVQSHLPGALLVVGAMCGDAGWAVRPAVRVELLPKYALTPIAFSCPAEEVPGIEQALAPMLHAPHVAMCEFVLADGEPVLVFARAARTLDAPLALTADLAEQKGAACLRYLTPATGHVERIEGLETARALPGVTAVVCRAAPGIALRHATSIAARDAAGYILAQAPTTGEAEQRAQAAAEHIHIITTAMS